MPRTVKCVIIEDEVSPMLEVLEAFASLGRANLFHFLLVGESAADIRAEEALAEVSTLRRIPKGSDVAPLLGELVGPGDLVFVDLLLGKETVSHFNGVDVVTSFLDGRSGRERDSLNEKLELVFISGFPQVMGRQHDAVEEIGRSLRLGTRFREKTADFVWQLIEIVDMWRVSNGLTGKGPGPMLDAYVSQRRELRPAFQPVVNLRTGVIRYYEMLSRDSKGGTRCPGLIFDEADALGGEWTQKIELLALETFFWQAGGLEGNYTYSANVSSSTLVSAEFERRFLKSEELWRWSVRPHNTLFELLEGVIRKPEGDSLVDVRATLRERGFSFAVDDFGRAGASLERLSTLRPEVVKVDAGYMRALRAKDSFRRLFRGLFDWAQEARPILVAEGIDSTFSAEEVAELLKLGFWLGQGFVFGKGEVSPAREIDDEGLRLLREVWQR